MRSGLRLGGLVVWFIAEQPAVALASPEAKRTLRIEGFVVCDWGRVPIGVEFK